MALTGKRFVANLAFFLAVVKVPSDVFEVRSLGAQLDRTQLTLKQLVAGLVHVVLVLSEAVFVRRHKVALVARIRLGRRVTCTTGKSHFDWNHSLHTSFYLRTNIYFQVMHLTPQLYTWNRKVAKFNCLRGTHLSVLGHEPRVTNGKYNISIVYYTRRQQNIAYSKNKRKTYTETHRYTSIDIINA